MAEGKGFFESLLDFSFRECVTINNRRLLYGLHLLVGLIAAVAVVVVGFQTSPTQGLINLIGALLGSFSGPSTSGLCWNLCWLCFASPKRRRPTRMPDGNANARDRISNAAEPFVAADSISWAFGSP
jgi:hypothetical protein